MINKLNKSGKPGLSRRGFLRQAGLFIAGIWLGSSTFLAACVKAKTPAPTTTTASPATQTTTASSATPPTTTTRAPTSLSATATTPQTETPPATTTQQPTTTTAVTTPATTAATASPTTPATASRTVLADFENNPPLAGWTFGAATGASGALSTAAGHSGKGGRLTYDFSGEKTTATKFVWAALNLDTPVAASGISFWARAPAGITISLRVRDSAGRTLLCPLTRPFHQAEPENWYQYSVALDSAPPQTGDGGDSAAAMQVRSVAIFANAVSKYASAGELLFDDLEAYPAFYLDLASVEATPVAEALAQLGSRLGVNIHFPLGPDYMLDERALDMAQQAGFTWLRMDCPWAEVYKGEAVYDFSHQDRLVAAAEARGMKLVFILDYGHELVTGAWNNPPTTPAAVRAFGDYVFEAARHFAGHAVVWEVWNEPNYDVFWRPQADAARYSELLKEAVSRLHQGNPEAQVIVGGLAGYDFAFLEAYLAAGAASNADAIGIHPYGLTKPEEVSDCTLLMRALVKKYIAANPPVWDTEWGYSSTEWGDGHAPEARLKQARYVCREIVSAWAAGFPLIIYYDIRDDGTEASNLQHNFGLITNDYLNKPAMQAVKTLTDTAKNRRLNGMVNTTPSSLHMLQLEGQDNRVFIAWYDILSGQARVIVPQAARVTDFLGSPLPTVVTSRGSVITISQDDGPVYITVPK